MMTMTERGGLTGWLRDARLSNFEWRDDWAAAKTVWESCVQYAAGVLPWGDVPVERNWLVLVGNYGTGKSHLAAGLVFDLLLSGKTARFVPWVDRLDEIRDTFGDRGKSTSNLMQQFFDPYLLAIDDLDKEPATSWAQKMLYRVINWRYNHSQPLVLTLNHGLESEAVQTLMPPAVLDRVLERAWKVVRFEGASYRSGLTLEA